MKKVFCTWIWSVIETSNLLADIVLESHMCFLTFASSAYPFDTITTTPSPPGPVLLLVQAPGTWEPEPLGFQPLLNRSRPHSPAPSQTVCNISWYVNHWMCSTPPVQIPFHGSFLCQLWYCDYLNRKDRQQLVIVRFFHCGDCWNINCPSWVRGLAAQMSTCPCHDHLQPVSIIYSKALSLTK